MPRAKAGTPEREAEHAAYLVWAHEESAHSHIALCYEGRWWCPCWCHRHGHPEHPKP